jgi:hypothetical protein
MVGSYTKVPVVYHIMLDENALNFCRTILNIIEIEKLNTLSGSAMKIIDRRIDVHTKNTSIEWFILMEINAVESAVETYVNRFVESMDEFLRIMKSHFVFQFDFEKKIYL